SGSRTPLTAEAPGLVMVIVSVAVPFAAIGFGANALATVSEPAGETVRFAVAVLPIPPLVELTAPVVLAMTPALVPCTVMVTVQVLFGVRLAPVSATELPPAVAATTPPVQVVVVLSGIATIRPVGNTSLNWTPVSVVVLFGLPIMNVSVEVPFSGITFGVK